MQSQSVELQKPRFIGRDIDNNNVPPIKDEYRPEELFEFDVKKFEQQNSEDEDFQAPNDAYLVGPNLIPESKGNQGIILVNEAPDSNSSPHSNENDGSSGSIQRQTNPQEHIRNEFYLQNHEFRKMFSYIKHENHADLKYYLKNIARHNQEYFAQHGQTGGTAAIDDRYQPIDITQIYNDKGLSLLHYAALNNCLDSTKVLCNHVRIYGKGKENDDYESML